MVLVVVPLVVLAVQVERVDLTDTRERVVTGVRVIVVPQVLQAVLTLLAMLLAVAVAVHLVGLRAVLAVAVLALKD